MGLVCVGFSASEDYPRPWENDTWLEENPYAASFFGMPSLASSGSMLEEEDREDLEEFLQITVPDFQNSLEEMQLEKVESGISRRGENSSYIENAIGAKEDASEIELEVEDLVPGKYGWDLFTYPWDWTDCTEYSLLGLEEYGEMVNEKRAEFESWRGKLVNGGVCDDNYTGGGIEYCEMPLEDVQCEFSGLWDEVPVFSWYYGCIEDHWVTVDALDEKITSINQTYRELGDSCEEGKVLAEEKGELAEDVVSEMAREEVSRIYRSSYGEGNSRAQGIKGEYEELMGIKEVADGALREAKNAEEGDGKWIKDCIMGSGTAVSGYTVIAQSRIIEEAEEVVWEYGEEAEETLEDAKEKENKMGEMGKAWLDDAEGHCRSGEAGSLGGRFKSYGKCKKYANMALNSAEQGEGAEEAIINEELAWLEEFIEKANTDGIDTHTEEVQYAILEQTMPSNYQEIIENIEEGILEKAENRYGGLPGRREYILSQISMDGSKPSFLETWLTGEECYSGNELDYRCALGMLSEIEESYDEIEAEFAANKDSLVQDSLVVDAYEQVGIPVLDGNASQYLYVDIKNPTRYSGEGLTVEAYTDIEYRKIDLVRGKGEVRLVTPKSGRIAIELVGINASETISLAFKKQGIVCRTKKHEEEAEGDDAGGAEVKHEIKFSCEEDVGGLMIGGYSGIESVTVDGITVPYTGEGIGRPLAKGTHTLELRSHDYDAYEVEREVSFITTFGQTTNVELFFTFHPKRDLDYIAYSSTEEGKGMEEIDIFGYTGERITEKNIIGESTVFFKVHELEAGKPTKVRLSYEMNNLEEYVTGQVLLYQEMNLSSGETAILEETQTYLQQGDEESAYEKIEELRDVFEDREKKESKVLKKHEKLKEEIEEKMARLESALRVAEGLGVNNTYTQEMEARVAELGSAIEEDVPDGALISPLESIDMGWEKKEITKISRALLDREEEIKERWAESGYYGEGTEEAITEVEEKNSQFSGSLNLDDAMEAFDAALRAEEVLDTAEESKSEEDAAMEGVLGETVSEAYDVLEDYTREYEEADETHLEGNFLLKPYDVSRYLKKADETGDFGETVGEIEGMVGKMEGTLELLKNEKERLGENLEALYEDQKESMAEEDRKFVESAMATAENYAGNGEYVRAIKSLEAGLERMDNFERKQDGLLILAITGLLVLGIIGLYLMRDRIPPHILDQGKKEKTYRKLKREQ
ncbi:hypothetical protein GF415_05095 [Candidatus Micrarchaeota archaeon]|nr:hypothetical protein [Candidatus Micrarchaeota archaeon]